MRSLWPRADFGAALYSTENDKMSPLYKFVLALAAILGIVIALAVISSKTRVTPPPWTPQGLGSLETALQGEDQRSLGDALQAVTHEGSEKSATDLLIRTLKDSNTHKRELAANALGYFSGRAGDEVIDALIEALNDDEIAVRRQAAESLGVYGTKARDAVPSLIRALDDDDAKLRSKSIRALSKIGHAPDGIIDRLLQLLLDDDLWVRGEAGSALMALRTQALPVLIDRLNDEDVDRRRLAARALGHVMVFDVAAVAALSQFLRDDDLQVRVHVASALVHPVLVFSRDVPTDAIRTTLIDGLRCEDRSTRVAALSCLSRLGRQMNATEAIPAIISALGDDDKDVRGAAYSALGAFGSEAKSAVPVMMEAMRKESGTAREYAIISIRKIDPDAVKDDAVASPTPTGQPSSVSKSASQ